MEEIVYSLNLDLRKNTHQVLVMKEGDVNSRVIEAVITDNGKPYDLTNCAVNLKWKKPDGHVVYSEINTVNDNTVTVVCTEQMLVAGGLAEAEFEIIDKTSEKVISTLKFSISINKTVSDNFEIESSDDFSALRTQYGVMKGHVEDTSIHLPTDGSSGQILKLDEDNNASWQDVFSLTKDEYEKLSNIEDNAEVNQNAFSNVKVGTTTISADSKTDTLTLVAGDNVTITPDTNGDKITISSSDTDNKVEQRNGISSVDRRILLSTSANDEKETNYVVKSANFTANPSTGAFYAKGFDRIDISNQTFDVNTLTLSSGSPMVMKYIEKTNGGSANITNIPVTNAPFILDVELIRWASTTDYITKQTFISSSAQANEHVRYCTSGTWGSWTKRVFTDTNTDTKNTAGSTNSSSKLFLVGATSQAANPQTYSHDTTYVGADGHLYSNSKQVVNLSDTQALTNKTYNGYTLAAACAKTVTDSSSASAIGTGTSLVTERDVYYGLPTINGAHAYTSGTNIYAPTSVGTNGYVLKSSGSGAPSWSSWLTSSLASTSTNLGLTASAGKSLQDQITALNNNLIWKSFTDITTLNANNCKEIYIECITSNNVVLSFNIPYIALSSTVRQYVTGYYDGTYYGKCVLNVSNDNITINAMIVGNQAVPGTKKMYYR